MSEIRANTVSNAAGTGPVTLTGQSAAKAWVNFNGTGTIAARDSLNVSSLTDNGSGSYTVNLTNAMGNANYAMVAMVTYTSGPYISGHDANIVQTASTYRVLSSSTGGGLVDSPVATSKIHGDLA